ncbi:MAG: PEP-CTERM sorting domain-containing protein [Thermodesulfobacteriota bacterium]
MKKIAIISALLILVFGLSNSAFAMPLPNTYSTSAGTLIPGFWMEDFSGSPGYQMGAGNSVLTAIDTGHSLPPTTNPTQPYQWSLSMTSLPAALYSGGAPQPSTSTGTWNYQTVYNGTITIGPAYGTHPLTTGDYVPFTVSATNYNVTYNTTTGQLEWLFVAHGTNSGYIMDVTATYLAAPYAVNPSNPLWFGDFVTAIQMTMTITQAPVPEPATMMLLGSGLVGLWGFRKKFRK